MKPDRLQIEPKVLVSAAPDRIPDSPKKTGGKAPSAFQRPPGGGGELPSGRRPSRKRMADSAREHGEKGFRTAPANPKPKKPRATRAGVAGGSGPTITVRADDNVVSEAGPTRAARRRVVKKKTSKRNTPAPTDVRVGQLTGETPSPRRAADPKLRNIGRRPRPRLQLGSGGSKLVRLPAGRGTVARRVEELSTQEFGAMILAEFGLLQVAQKVGDAVVGTPQQRLERVKAVGAVKTAKAGIRKKVAKRLEPEVANKALTRLAKQPGSTIQATTDFGPYHRTEQFKHEQASQSSRQQHEGAMEAMKARNARKFSKQQAKQAAATSTPAAVQGSSAPAVTSPDPRKRNRKKMSKSALSAGAKTAAKVGAAFARYKAARGVQQAQDQADKDKPKLELGARILAAFAKAGGSSKPAAKSTKIKGKIKLPQGAAGGGDSAIVIPVKKPKTVKGPHPDLQKIRDLHGALASHLGKLSEKTGDDVSSTAHDTAHIETMERAKKAVVYHEKRKLHEHYDNLLSTAAKKINKIRDPHAKELDKHSKEWSAFIEAVFGAKAAPDGRAAIRNRNRAGGLYWRRSAKTTRGARKRRGLTSNDLGRYENLRVASQQKGAR